MVRTQQVLRNSGQSATVRGVRVTEPWYGGKRQATVHANTQRRQNARYNGMSFANRQALLKRQGS